MAFNKDEENEKRKEREKEKEEERKKEEKKKEKEEKKRENEEKREGKKREKEEKEKEKVKDKGNINAHPLPHFPAIKINAITRHAEIDHPIWQLGKTDGELGSPPGKPGSSITQSARYIILICNLTKKRKQTSS